MSKSVKEQALDVMERLYPGADGPNRRDVDALAAAGLLNDERAQACVEACKAYGNAYGYLVGTLVGPAAAVASAGAAYDEPKPTLAELAERAAHMLFETTQTGPAGIELAQQIKEALAASVKGEKP